MLSRRAWSWGGLALAFALVLSFAGGALAQPDGGTTLSPTLDELVKAARDSGATILIDGRTQPAATAGSPGTAASPSAALESAVAVRHGLAQTIGRIPEIPGAIGHAVLTARGDGSAGWLWLAIPLTLIALAVGSIVGWLVWRWASRVLASLEARAEAVPAPRTSYAMLRTLLAMAAAAAFLLSGIAVIVVFVPTPGPARATAAIILVAITAYRITIALMTAVFMPSRPTIRLLPVDDATAARMLRAFKVMAATGFAFFGLALWTNEIGVDERSTDALQILASAVPITLLCIWLIVHRRVITAMIRGTSPRPNTFRKFLGSIWAFIVLGYLVIAGAAHISQVVTTNNPHAGPLLAPILAAIVGLSIYGACVIVLSRRFAALENTLRATIRPADALAAADDAPLPPAPPGEAPLAAAPPSGPTEAEVEPLLVWQARWHALFRRLAGLAAIVVAIVVLVVSLGVLKLDHDLTQTLGYVVILFAVWGVYDAMRTWIDGRMRDEMPAVGHGDSEDGMGPGSSRLATLLPLLRNILIAAMFTLMLTIALAAMGVNVAPLFAGAGVLGLAIGFGAQTLIRDVFSGAFFLADDAFRKGEFIDVGGVMGAVEKISIRSFQLRHQNGPLHTIPFGEIKQLTNYSRDWVVMKLPLRIPYGTDVERVRKLIKKLGQELLEDPECGPLFLAPLKSQGVIEMEDSAMIIRVKFMTKPGDQFVVRRHVYTRIGELFDREGIQFAHRYVTVRIDPPDAPADQQQAAAAAAEQILNQEEEQRRA
ncbi:mechanosensitive ion channel family protein [Acuticoccus sediminis]|uniref:mechanosensitive ion channel family protein n=1 Tax=Acuticoccus sediminis TaxID=2184697 RepID=UPI001CFCA39E|nr:mechanosensitive ion channel domain-containing protein [Acuticoccus sediminis]